MSLLFTALLVGMTCVLLLALGVAPEDSKKPFPYGEERFGIPRRSDLRFEVLERHLI